MDSPSRISHLSAVYEVLIILTTIGLSLLFWGFIRTAVWLVPGLFLQEFLPLLAASLFCFFTVLCLFRPYRNQQFNFHGWPKERWILVFFLTGVLTGTLLYPVIHWFFALGALLPWATLQVFRLLRYPAPQALSLQQYWMWILPICWLGLFILKLLERQSF